MHQITDQDRVFLKRAVELAREATDEGSRPFGSANERFVLGTTPGALPDACCRPRAGRAGPDRRHLQRRADRGMTRASR